MKLIKFIYYFFLCVCLWQQGKIPQAEKAIKALYGKERVAEVIHDLTGAGQGSTESEAGWFDLFSSRYWKGIKINLTESLSNISKR